MARFVNADDIRVVTEQLPPYQVVENGKLTGGFSYLIMEEALKRANINAHSEVMPWARAYKTALDEKNTIIYSITRSRKRESLFQWVGQLHSLEYGFFSMSSNDKIKVETLEDALNYNVVSVRDSFEASSLQSKGFIEGKNLILVIDYASAWKMLQLGRADLTYGNAPVAFANNHLNATSFERQGDVIESFDLYVAVNLKTDKTVVKNLTNALQSVKEDALFTPLFQVNTF